MPRTTTCVQRKQMHTDASSEPCIVLTQSGLVRAMFDMEEQEDIAKSARFWSELYGSAVTRYEVDVRIAVLPVAGTGFRSDQDGWTEIDRVRAPRFTGGLARHRATTPVRQTRA